MFMNCCILKYIQMNSSSDSDLDSISDDSDLDSYNNNTNNKNNKNNTNNTNDNEHIDNDHIDNIYNDGNNNSNTSNNDLDFQSIINIPNSTQTIPVQFDKLITNVLSKVYYGTLIIDFKMSPELFNYILNRGLIDKFTQQSLSLYSPIECLYKIKNKIKWDVVISRDDLDQDFIKQNIHYFNIQEMNYKCFLPFNFMVENIKNNTFTSFDKMVYKLLCYGKYSFNDFMKLIKLISNRLKHNSSDILYYENNYQDFYKKYVNVYYRNNSPINVVNLKNFIGLFFDVLKESSSYSRVTQLNNKYYSHYLFEFIKDKLSPTDLEYLIQNNIFDYYCGSCNIPKKLFNVFYNYRYHLIHPGINPLLMKGYDIKQMEDLINYSIQVGVSKKTVWSYVSEFILNLDTPYWFWKKYKKDIVWQYSVESIIEKLDESNSKIMDLFMVWLLDNYDMIENGFIKKIHRCYIFPDIFIACFAKTNNTSGILNRSLKLQKVSLSVLYYLAKNNYLNSQNWGDISSFQILSPDFIKMYSDKLNWDLLKFNPTWQEFDNKLFHKLPEFNSENKLLWQSCDEKLKIINAFANTSSSANLNSGIKVVKDSNNPNLLVLNLCLYEDLNYLSRQQNIKDKYYEEKPNWKIRHHNWDSYKINRSDYHKIVYNFNPDIMDGRNTTLLGTMNSCYIPMSVGFISHLNYGIGTIKQIKIPYNKLIFSTKKPQSYTSPTYNIPFAVYIPLEFTKLLLS
jgi:hypothetical protein